jgi:hypothetical protein
MQKMTAQLTDHHIFHEECPSHPYLIKNYFFHMIDILTVGSQMGWLKPHQESCNP